LIAVSAEYSRWRHSLEPSETSVEALNRLPTSDARQRVLQWAAGVFGVEGGRHQVEHPMSATHGGALEGVAGTLNELLDRADPSNRQERILTVAYWLQVEQGHAEWTSQAVNDLLKDLGEGVPNITDALASLVARRPSLVRQMRKSGRTQQARKRYSLTEAGRQTVRDLVSARGQRRD
jgi:DNA-binding MarR family transcriptional regulator